MKKNIPLIWSLFLLACVSVRAQYLIVPVVPPPMFGFNDLWHFSVTRSTADNLSHFYVSLRVLDGNNQLQIKSNSATLVLPVGTQYYNSSNLQPLQPFVTSFHGGGLLQQAVSSGGTFPPGTYALVYTLYGRANDGEFVPLCEEALTVTVEAMWPPMLLSPVDEEAVTTTYPLLTWTPAFSSSYVGVIDYTLNLVELLPGQNAYQAIQANPLYFTQSSISVTTLPYPPAAQTLETGKKYAWQVHAQAGGASLGSSEVWWFTLATPTEDAEPADSSRPFYLELTLEYPQSFFLTYKKQIPFRFQSTYNQDEVKNITFTLTREGQPQPILTSETCGQCLLVTKEVYYTLNLEDNNDLNPGFYLLTVSDNQQRSQYLRILYKEYE